MEATATTPCLMILCFQYKSVVKEAFPPVYHTKAMIKQLLEEGTITTYCDFHAHSRKFNIFMWVVVIFNKIKDNFIKNK